MARPEILLWVSLAAMMAMADAGTSLLGVNWGPIVSHPIDPKSVVKMLKANHITKVKLFDANSDTVNALAGTGIEVILGIPNDRLDSFSEDYGKAEDWVRQNVTAFVSAKPAVNVTYVAVGNEPFLKSYNGSFVKSTFPALQNIQKALNKAGVGDKIKAVVPLNADVYNSPANKPVPSAGDFRADMRKLMVNIVHFLQSNNAPFVVNIYPFLSLYNNPNFPKDFAFFDGNSRPIVDSGKTYSNVFDANFDTLVWSLKKAGAGDLNIIVGEVGWPTDGDINGNVANAKRFYDGLLLKLGKKQGTPMRPIPIEGYIFSLIDEDMKSVLPGSFERHWGIFTYDGKPKFPLDLSGKNNIDKHLVPAQVEYLPDQWCVLKKDVKELYKLPGNMDYACSLGDCTALGYGSSCNGLSKYENASYAFNMYFQMQDQDVRACDFAGLAEIVTKNASTDDCLFPIQIISSAVPAPLPALGFVVGFLLLLVFSSSFGSL